MMMVTEVFKALSDPVRLEMIQRLSKAETLTLGSISSDLGVTRQGARKHIDVLEKADLIFLQKMGRKTEVKLNKDSLAVVKEFIAKLEQQWDERLLKLKKYVEDQQ